MHCLRDVDCGRSYQSHVFEWPQSLQATKVDLCVRWRLGVYFRVLVDLTVCPVWLDAKHPRAYFLKVTWSRMSYCRNEAKAKTFTPRSSSDDHGLWSTQSYAYIFQFMAFPFWVIQKCTSCILLSFAKWWLNIEMMIWFYVLLTCPLMCSFCNHISYLNGPWCPAYYAHTPFLLYNKQTLFCSFECLFTVAACIYLFHILLFYYLNGSYTQAAQHNQLVKLYVFLQYIIRRKGHSRHTLKHRSRTSSAGLCCIYFWLCEPVLCICLAYGSFGKAYNKN